MGKETIYNLLKERNLNATMIARSLGITPQAVHKVINDGHGSLKVVKAIATVCEKDYKNLFPYYLREKEAFEKKDLEKRQRDLDKALAKLA